MRWEPPGWSSHSEWFKNRITRLAFLVFCGLVTFENYIIACKKLEEMDKNE